MEIFWGIKPEIVSLFSANASASITINIGLNPPIFASDVTQELKIDFIVLLLKHITIWHLQTYYEKTVGFFWSKVTILKYIPHRYDQFDQNFEFNLLLTTLKLKERKNKEKIVQTTKVFIYSELKKNFVYPKKFMGMKCLVWPYFLGPQ
jgi:hypothetical protein